MTKGESSKDAAGNTVKIRNQKGEEVKVLTENHASLATAVLRGLIVLHSEVTEKPAEYVLAMGLSQQNITNALKVSQELSRHAPAQTQGVAAKQGRRRHTPAPEVKTNPEAEDYLR